MANTAPMTPPNGNLSLRDERVDALEKRLEALTLQLSKLSGAPATPSFALKKFELEKRRPTPPLTPPSPAASDASKGVVEDPIKPFEQLNQPPVKKALAILDIVQRYGQNSSPSDIPWAGKARFLPCVEAQVKKSEPIRMVLPAFPFKSPNRKNKVLGALPDLGEELALQHLNGLCESIREIYEPGAKVFIASDGLVYNGEYALRLADVSR